MRFVHLTLDKNRKSIRRAGIKAGPTSLPEVSKGVFALPVLMDYAITHQWTRELRRWSQGQRIVAVYFKIPDGLKVWVGRYGQPHQEMAAWEAGSWTFSNPHGAQVLIPRNISPHEIGKIWEMSQLVGWTETPETAERASCVCQACLPPGLPNLRNRLNGMFEHAVADLRRATTATDQCEALLKAQVPLERARGRISPRRILSYAASPHRLVRATFARMLWEFSWKDVEETLLTLLNDPELEVQESAAYSVWKTLGSVRAADYLKDHAAASLLFFLLEWEHNEEVHLKALDILKTSASPEVRAEVVRRIEAQSQEREDG